jgi:error-prone DNA polymerase
MTKSDRVYTDFETVGLSLESHPVGLLRTQLTKLGAVTAEALQHSRAGHHVRVGGLVIVRQRPPTAKGFCFLSVEDETGIANFVIEPRNFEKYRQAVTGTALVVGSGRIERNGKVVNLKIDHIAELVPDG